MNNKLILFLNSLPVSVQVLADFWKSSLQYNSIKINVYTYKKVPH